jgi:hypothetical protein
MTGQRGKETLFDAMRSPNGLPQMARNACHICNFMTQFVVYGLAPHLKDEMKARYVRDIKPGLDFIDSVKGLGPDVTGRRQVQPTLTFMTSDISSKTGCYAERLGDCRGPVNAEHVVSRVLLDAIWEGARGGRVYGLTFLHATSENPASIGIRALTSHILCEGHNSGSSSLDTESAKLFRAMERLVLAENKGEPVATNSYVRGDLVERWMFKTLVNGLFSGNFPIPFTDSFAGHLPNDEALQMIFRGAPIPKGQGIYVSHERSLVDHQVFRLEVVGYPQGIAGLRMWMLGSLFSLVLTDEKDVFPELQEATYRPGKLITAKTRNALMLSWPDNFAGETLEIRMSDGPAAAE